MYITVYCILNICRVYTIFLGCVYMYYYRFINCVSQCYSTHGLFSLQQFIYQVPPVSTFFEITFAQKKSFVQDLKPFQGPH